MVVLPIFTSFIVTPATILVSHVWVFVQASPNLFLWHSHKIPSLLILSLPIVLTIVRRSELRTRWVLGRSFSIKTFSYRLVSFKCLLDFIIVSLPSFDLHVATIIPGFRSSCLFCFLTAESTAVSRNLRPSFRILFTSQAVFSFYRSGRFCTIKLLLTRLSCWLPSHRPHFLVTSPTSSPSLSFIVGITVSSKCLTFSRTNLCTFKTFYLFLNFFFVFINLFLNVFWQRFTNSFLNCLDQSVLKSAFIFPISSCTRLKNLSYLVFISINSFFILFSTEDIV